MCFACTGYNSDWADLFQEAEETKVQHENKHIMEKDILFLPQKLVTITLI